MDDVKIVANPDEGYDRQDPAPGPVLFLSIATLITIVLVFVFVFAYYGAVADYEQQKQVGEVEARDLREIRAAAAKALKGDEAVRSLPVEEAMNKFESEVRGGKLFYPAVASPVKTDAALAAPGAPADGGKPAAPAAAPVAPAAAH
jgi:hypothetical protein